MKKDEGYNKLRGGYYTPPEIAKYISNWAVRAKSDIVLEPSCGDGVFLKAVTERKKELGAKTEERHNDVIGIELDSTEAQKAAVFQTQIYNSDFFGFYENSIEGKMQFDAIVGNPPFIRYQNFDEKCRGIAFSLMEKKGFHPNRLTNIWLPFLVLSCFALKDDGRLGMVIPAELFQVDYAAETRKFLSNYFEALTLITFKKLLFDDIQQEVVLLLGERKSEKKGIQVIELDGIGDLYSASSIIDTRSEIKNLQHDSEKWVKYYLSSEELQLLELLSHDVRISNANDLYEVNVGLVSGENSFFLIDKKTVEAYKLNDFVLPIIGKSEQVSGIRLRNEDYTKLAENGKKVYLFVPRSKPIGDLPIEAQNYIKYGEAKKYNENYKCRIRQLWYIVPESWKADAFLIRQANLYPKMILNDKKALVTDTLHKVRFHEGINGTAVAAAFINSYTLALSETLGRS